MSKTAYYLEYPDKGIASIIKHDFEDSVIWTAEKPDSDAIVALLRQEGYTVIAFVSAAYEDEDIGRSRRKWHPIEVDTARGRQILSSFAQNIKTLKRWAREDEEAYEDYEERRQRLIDLMPSAAS